MPSEIEPRVAAESRDFVAARGALLDEPTSDRAARRAALSDLTDAWLSGLFEAGGAGDLGACLVAVGGYGRRELAPGSDLDLLLLVPDDGDPRVAVVAERLWYPAWDTGIPLDHAVRSPASARRLAAADIRVLLGLLDARPVAGDTALAEGLRASVLADWRGLARGRFAELRSAAQGRRAARGDLAHLVEPDLKESHGGLRDATVLRAIAASWVADVPRHGLDDAHGCLLDVRDALHEEQRAAGRRPADRLSMHDQDAVAKRLGLADADDLLRTVSSAARTIAYAADTTWHRIDRLTRRRSVAAPRGRRRRPGPERTPLAAGVVVQDGEVMLAAEARPERDPGLVLRAAAAAAQARLPLSPGAVHRLAADSAPLPVPWPRPVRESLVSLLGSGEGLVPVWEALDQAGIVERIIPAWSEIRAVPQRNPLHVFTVDRHLVEAAVHAGDRVRRVDRPDLLLVGALLHDIGKGRVEDHTEVGIELVSDIGPHLGFDADDTAVLVDLVRHHLLLPDVATRRDLEDPATISAVAAAVGSRRTLDLLHALTEADAAATGPAAWSEWKAALVEELVARTRAALDGEPVEALIGPDRLSPERLRLLDDTGTVVLIEPDEGDPEIRWVVTVVADDRLGLLGLVAGVLALNRLEVRSADTETRGRRALTSWTVAPLFGEPPSVERLRQDLLRALEGDLDVAARLRARQVEQGPGSPPAVVEFVPGASDRADVLEVRAHDRPGLLHDIGTALAASGAFVLSTRISTLGSEVVDVFYLVRPDGERLGDDQRLAIRTTVRATLAEASGVAG